MNKQWTDKGHWYWKWSSEFDDLLYLADISKQVFIIKATENLFSKSGVQM